MDDVPVSTGTAITFPSGSLFMVPGVYLFGGVKYDCTVAGLYRFLDPSNLVIQQRIVHINDLYTLMSSISWVHVHGTQSESILINNPPSISFQLLSNSGQTRKLALRCGYVTQFLYWLLPLFGYQIRAVNLVTLETPNGFDDGHIISEVFHEGKWKAWDITSGCYFTHNGEHLSTAEIIQFGVMNCTRVPLDLDAKRTADLAGSFDLGMYTDMAFLTQSQQDAWFSRIYQSVV